MNNEQDSQPTKSDTADDVAGVVIMTTVKISDPNTGEVLLRVRGDE